MRKRNFIWQFSFLSASKKDIPHYDSPITSHTFTQDFPQDWQKIFLWKRKLKLMTRISLEGARDELRTYDVKNKWKDQEKDGKLEVLKSLLDFFCEERNRWKKMIKPFLSAWDAFQSSQNVSHRKFWSQEFWKKIKGSGMTDNLKAILEVSWTARKITLTSFSHFFLSVHPSLVCLWVIRDSTQWNSWIELKQPETSCYLEDKKSTAYKRDTEYKEEITSRMRKRISDESGWRTDERIYWRSN